MPGIAGLISRRPPDECERVLADMLASMHHENFYSLSTYSERELGVFAGCVAMKGSHADCQPAVSKHGDIAVLFAGDCVVDSDTAHGQRPGDDGLGPRAHRIIDLYEKTKDNCFLSLNGLFSGLLVDQRHRQLLLFNDRFGMERLYYHVGRDGFFFASEAKALLRVLPDLRRFDEKGLRDYLRYGCTLDWDTLFPNIKILPGGSLWVFNDEHRCDRRRYFEPMAWANQPRLTPDSYEDELGQVFGRILPRYFEPESDVGISLTGGLDTRMIMACRPKSMNKVVAYTFAATHGDTMDVVLAARVAAACGIPHHVVRLDSDFFTDFAAFADRTVSATDGYSSICGAHEIYLNKEARRLAPIRLTGNFGSEILRGMSTFKPVALSDDLISPDLRGQLCGDTVDSSQVTDDPVTFAAFKEIPWLLFGVVRAAHSQLSTRTPYLDNELVSLAFRMHKTLRGSAPAITRLVRKRDETLARIPTDTGVIPASSLRSLLRRLFYRVSFKLDYISKDGMPHWLAPLDTRTRRFTERACALRPHRYLEYRRWFQANLAEFVRERLTDPAIHRNGFWKKEYVDRLPHAHIEGHRNYLREINTVLTLEAIDRLIIRQSITRIGAQCRLR